MPSPSILDKLARISERIRSEFKSEHRVLSFDEYLELFGQDPVRHSRNASQYVRDAFDFFGKEEVEKPWGKCTRFLLFDLPWMAEDDATPEALVGQEEVQTELYRILCNFVRGGRANKLALLHGPNGSAKSTVARCAMLALEHYSKLDEGALYRFHWVFPSERTTRGAIGFGNKPAANGKDDSYAYLPEESIDARLFDEVRDHPLLLLPLEDRRALLLEYGRRRDPSFRVNHWLWNGTLCHKNRTVFDALMASTGGDLREVLRHVQVERYFISRRYRTGAATIGPELSIDARERQITADRSLAALPSSLQAVSLYEAHGELIDASGGMLEFSDLLKRPIDAFKYLQQTIETGEISLTSQGVYLNCVMLGSANEVELAAFRQHHEFESFRGRVELVRTPYLRSWIDEQRIYDAQVAPQVRAHVVPHATRIAAMFAVLTRLRKPDAERYRREVRDVVRGLTAFEKLELYATGAPPERLDAEKARLLQSVTSEIYHEWDSSSLYEGAIGASPREMRTVLLDAAQNPTYHGLSPFAALEELERLCARESEYIWLQQDVTEGGYHDHAEFRKLLRRSLLDTIEDELRQASGLVDETRYSDLFNRYIEHVSYWVKKEKLRNPITGAFESPDERLMAEVEELLDFPDDPVVLRHSWMNQVAAWAIEHPGEPIDNEVVFASAIRRLRDSVFEERRAALSHLGRNLVHLVRDEEPNLPPKERTEAEQALEQLCQRFGYEPGSAADSVAMLVRERFQLSL